MEITFDGTHLDTETGKMVTDYRVINIMPGIHGYIENQAKDICTMRDWHDNPDPELHDPLMTPEMEKELMQIQVEFEALYERTERLLMPEVVSA